MIYVFRNGHVIEQMCMINVSTICDFLKIKLEQFATILAGFVELHYANCIYVKTYFKGDLGKDRGCRKTFCRNNLLE